MAEGSNALPLYVVVPPSRLFAAHWSFFLPDSPSPRSTAGGCEQSDVGRRIHVSGDRLNGFQLEIVRGYDISKHRGVTTSRRYKIGAVPVKYLHARGSEAGRSHGDANVRPAYQKDDDEGGGYVDDFLRDDFEEACSGIPAPGPSLNKVGNNTDNGAPPVCSDGHKKVARPSEVRDCQWWTKQVVEALMEKGMLISPAATMIAAEATEVESPLHLVSALPKH